MHQLKAIMYELKKRMWHHLIHGISAFLLTVVWHNLIHGISAVLLTVVAKIEPTLNTQNILILKLFVG